MEINILDCNNINQGTLSLIENTLNIKYAINGTGKSTISKAITSHISDKTSNTHELGKLKPFKYINTKENNPTITGIENLNRVKVFDEQYLNTYVFLPDELVKGSFDIFIRDDKYEKGMREINDLMSNIQNAFIENKDIDELINDFNELSSSFGRPVKTGIHASSNLSKAFKDGNKVLNIPPELDEYKDFIQSEDNYKWIKWLIDGMVYLNLSDNCPYCITNISKKREKILKIRDVYEPKMIEYLNKIDAVYERLNKYFTDDTNNKNNEFIININGYTEDQVRYLLDVKDQIDRLNAKFVGSKNLGFRSLKDVDKVIEMLNNQRIDIELYYHLNSEATRKKVDIINESIDILLKKAGELQGKINLQKRHIQELIEENNSEINGFLRNAGFNYHVNIVEDQKNQYSLKLIHDDIKDEVTDVKNHLSFGERNAFSIVLFMYDVLKTDADLIILDDPISSFDKNKKYAIIDMLFRRGEKSLRNKTVLLLTHDFEPIIDIVKHHSDRFEKPFASFLENNHGTLIEKEIIRENIKTFVEICHENVKTSNDITKLVYLRRYYEVINEKGNAYQLISNLLHKRKEPLTMKEYSIPIEDVIDGVIENEQMRKMTEDEKKDGYEEIKEGIDNFDYNKLLDQITNDEFMIKLYHDTSSNYEKLHIFRVLYGEKLKATETAIIAKFINEAFHIENDYIYQLNPCEYQLVPQYVIDECDLQIKSLDMAHVQVLNPLI
jgi:energy-coupling factor transporter ATP-binding protein EcfA2